MLLIGSVPGLSTKTMGMVFEESLKDAFRLKPGTSGVNRIMNESKKKEDQEGKEGKENKQDKQDKDDKEDKQDKQDKEYNNNTNNTKTPKPQNPIQLNYIIDILNTINYNSIS